ncbi:MAG: RNA polymerase subunit sigma-70, partial [Brevibacterium sp.]|nr:RNA polymerase subunit sigma-70 [Brevibacterium sp.]
MIIDRTVAAAKMAASRARRKVKEVPAPTGELPARRAVVDAFLAAAREGDFDALLRVLDPDVTWHRSTAHGDTVEVQARGVNANGGPGILVSTTGGRVLGLMSCTVAGGKLTDIVSILDHAWLARLQLPGS